MRGTERLTVQQIVEQSSNIGTITIAERLGAGRLASWVQRFGFGARTGIDFPGESAGFALPLDQWSGSTIGTVPIGHGIAVTPIQMARAYAVIANGGVLVKPHLIDRIDGTTVPTLASGGSSPARLGADALDAPRRRPRRNRHGGGDPRLHRRRQDRHRGEDRPRRPLLDVAVRGVVRRAGSATKPKLVIMVMVDEPHGDIYGGVVAAPAFRDIARHNLQYLEIPPDQPNSSVRQRRNSRARVPARGIPEGGRFAAACV